jgi:tRNA(His) guanylyltransferase
MLYLQAVMVDFPDIRIAFGESDEYSFVLHKDTQVYGK